jgi:hypothetical protein
MHAALLLAYQMCACKTLSTVHLHRFSVLVSVFQGAANMQPEVQNALETASQIESRPVKKQHCGKRPGAGRTWMPRRMARKIK